MDKDEILVLYGGDPEEMAYRIADAAGLESLIGGREKRIGLKPNLVIARTAESGATTHPEILRGLIRYLKEKGFRNIAIIEGSWVGDRTKEAFSVCGYTKLAKETGVDLIDTQHDTFTSYDCGGMSIDICDSAMKTDFMINLPVMKGHCQTTITCALKNNKGIIPNNEKRHFHTLGLHKPIAHLNLVAKNDFILVDGICGDLDFEEGGNPVFAGRLFAARDPVLCDAWAAEQMGYAPSEIPYIGMAEQLGVGSADTSKARVRELNRSADGVSFPKPLGRVQQLSSFIREDQACSACYAGLVFALSRISSSDLRGLKEPICIGQGFQGKTGRIGVGRCTAGFEASVKGCPPSAADILDLLQRHIR